MDDALPPNVTSYVDRHGTLRFRFRKKGLPERALPGSPGTVEFQKAYALALTGAPKRKPPAGGRFEPRTLAAAWTEVRSSIDWKKLKPISQNQQSKVAERFLAMPIATGEKMTFGEMPLAGINRGHIKKLLGRFDRPHGAASILRLLRKLAGVALDLEWIEHDPTYRIKFRPKLKGHRAFTDAELEQFEGRWPVGTPERLGFALALYTGQRRGDVAALQWTAFDGEWIAVTQEKTGAPLVIPAHPELRAILAATEQRAANILTGLRGRPYARESFGNLMADAIAAAGLPDECRLHGLRKSAGRCLAEAGATTRQIMAILGHQTLSEAERYTREASQRQLARAGMEQWSKPKLIAVK